MSHFPDRDFDNNIPPEHLELLSQQVLPPRLLTEEELTEETWTPDTIRANTHQAYAEIHQILDDENLSITDISRIIVLLLEQEVHAKLLSLTHSQATEITLFIRNRILAWERESSVNTDAYQQVKEVLFSSKLNEGARFSILTYVVSKDLIELGYPEAEADRLLQLMHDVLGDAYPG